MGIVAQFERENGRWERTIEADSAGVGKKMSFFVL